MFEVWVHSLISVAAVSALSLVGVLTLILRKKPRRRFLLYLVSFSVGGLFGDAFFHLIPEAAEASGFTPRVSAYILLGVLTSFVVEQCIRSRHISAPTSEEHHRSFAYMNLFGDAVHNIIDGMIIGGSYLFSTSTGFATTLAVCLHELPQEIGDFGILLYGGFKRRTALLFNFLTALTAFVGVLSALALDAYIEGLTLFLIPFAAGNFIYIAGSDLIPELQAEETYSNTVIQLIVMVLGISIFFSLKLMG